MKALNLSAALEKAEILGPLKSCPNPLQGVLLCLFFLIIVVGSNFKLNLLTVGIK